MESQPGETVGGQPARTDADERTADDTTRRPTFSPATRQAGHNPVPGGAGTDPRTASEPAVSYPDADEVGEPIEALSTADDDAPPLTGPPPPPPAAVADLDQPLRRADNELLARWQQVQIGFIDDPHAAVADAADLVERAGRALTEALEQRQRQMRTMWEHSPANGPAAPRDSSADTERLRQMMQGYRVLFNELCQPA